MKEETVKYLAGLIDADGSITFNFNNPTRDKRATLSLRIELGSSDAIDTHGFLESLPISTGYGSYQTYGKNNQFKKWVVTSRSHIEMLAPRLIKHMVIKGKHLNSLLEVWREQRGQLISEDGCEELRAFGKASRLNVGPLRPKNHPTWAWLAGFLDGDGSYRVGRVKGGFYNGKQVYRQQMAVHASAHIGDVSVLEFIQSAHGGYIKPHSRSQQCMIWERSLGKRDRDFAIDFLSNLASHSRLKKHRIEQLIHFHRQQRLSDQAPEGEAIV